MASTGMVKRGEPSGKELIPKRARDQDGGLRPSLEEPEEKLSEGGVRGGAPELCSWYLSKGSITVSSSSFLRYGRGSFGGLNSFLRKRGASNDGPFKNGSRSRMCSCSSLFMWYAGLRMRTFLLPSPANRLEIRSFHRS